MAALRRAILLKSAVDSATGFTSWHSSSAPLRFVNASTGSHPNESSRDPRIQIRLIADFLGKGNLEGVDRLKADVLSDGGVVNRVSFDTHFLAACSEVGAFDLGKQFFLKLRSEGTAGAGAVGKFFTMCREHRDKCGPEEHELILRVYDELMTKYGVLDVSTCTAMAQGVGLTNRWRSEIPRLLEMVRLSDATPSPSLWCAAVQAALDHGDTTVAWQLMDSYASTGKLIAPRLYNAILMDPALLPDLLRWMERHGIVLNNEGADAFVRSSGAQLSRVSRASECSTCRKKLLPNSLTTAEFDRLAGAFLDPVLIGRDVFQKTRPEEIKKFLLFLDEVLPVDVVLDGLNIAYASSRLSSKGSRLLRSVASYFSSTSQKILVIGRQHMKKWPAADMQFVANNASVFLAENLSEDDPFLLYATLKSGISTKFVSRDQMSGHRFLLKDPELRRIFTKWQSLRQFTPLYIAEDGNQVVLQRPLSFSRQPQCTSSHRWHLPVADRHQTNIAGHKQAETSPWLCVNVDYTPDRNAVVHK